MDWILSRAMMDGLKAFGRRFHFLHHAVYAVAEAEAFFERLKVDVGGAQFEGVHDDLVDEPDERRVGVHFHAVVLEVADLHVALGQLLDDVGERTLGHCFFFRAVILVQRGLDVRLGGHAQFDLRAEQMRERINRAQVGGVGDGDGDFVVGLENGDDAVFFCDVARDDGDGVVLDFHPGEMHDFRAELRGLGLRHVRRADDLVRHQKIHDAHAGGFRLRARFGDLLGICKAKVLKQVQQIIVFFCHDVLYQTVFLFWNARRTFHLTRQMSMQTHPFRANKIQPRRRWLPFFQRSAALFFNRSRQSRCFTQDN